MQVDAHGCVYIALGLAQASTWSNLELIAPKLDAWVVGIWLRECLYFATLCCRRNEVAEILVEDFEHDVPIHRAYDQAVCIEVIEDFHVASASGVEVGAGARGGVMLLGFRPPSRRRAPPPPSR